MDATVRALSPARGLCTFGRGVVNEAMLASAYRLTDQEIGDVTAIRREPCVCGEVIVAPARALDGILARIIASHNAQTAHRLYRFRAGGR